ncbi:cell wall-binding repeat-containing protein [Rossellomorea aquimaris]|uniref:cell wall-binding repeat-containing protein n=1 Tax=Rossellomorea aquimaris TaxID=189382 RepID=UPI001CD79E1E|nr:cell wall-binding repeat-containing protein [Rossellomorea aquimaris]MCA1055192.1 cell wall-binding repeat-containing protein [Rossellomorea aquimaris]
MKHFKSLFLAAVALCLIISQGNPLTVHGATTSITYSGNLPSYQNHTYHFSNASEGVLNVNFVNGNDMVYFITEAGGDGDSYISGDTLPVGEYEFTISPNSKISTNYEVTISGDLALTGQATLPSLNITSPSAAHTRLGIDDFNINFSGSSNGALNYTLNHNSPISLSSSFSKNLNLLFGSNTISTYAALTNKNYITDVRTVVSPGVMRLSGADRFDTAVNVSKEIEKEGYAIDTVIITNAYNFADGLPGVVLGHKEVAPLLTTRSDYLPAAIKSEITRLGATKAIILGGTGSISSAVENELVTMGLATERISGLDRYAVSASIAERIINEHSNSAIIVNGQNYPDGLMAAPYAGNTQQPILYTTPDSLPGSIKTFLNDHPNINEFTIVGGTGVVSQAVEAELEQYGSVYRVDGQDRYEVGINIGYGLDFQKRQIVLVSNESDGVPAALLSSLKDSQMMLTKPTALPGNVNDYITGLGYEGLLDNIYIVGGTASVSQSIEDYIRGVIQ